MEDIERLSSKFNLDQCQDGIYISAKIREHNSPSPHSCVCVSRLEYNFVSVCMFVCCVRACVDKQKAEDSSRASHMRSSARVHHKTRAIRNRVRVGASICLCVSICVMRTLRVRNQRRRFDGGSG